jgi:flavodoxin/NAD-dependent dihydropyrimidine dehydrogenase PreA subunit
MSLIRLILGRRQFLATSLSSVLMLVFARVARAFGLVSTGMAKTSEKPENVEKRPLKGIVVYYSATGNTAQVAKAIYKGMSSVIPCDVAPINKIDPKKMGKYDLMALGSPNWYFRVPSNVNVFTHDMPRMDGKPCIIFGTHGGMPYGQFWSMSRNVRKKGMTIIGWSDWYGSDFLTPHSCVPDGEWGHPDSIDLAEAEAFGKLMAENSIRIYAGEKNLIPDRIPGPDKGENNLWSPTKNESYKIQFAGGGQNAAPRFDFTKCVYPRCTRCIENCVANAIDFSALTTAGSALNKTSTASPLILKEACQKCGGICERVCDYDAITYAVGDEPRTFHKIDMTKCTYPKCTACLDNCPQSCIDLTRNPPIIHNRCENESLCWGVCPENAIEPTATSTGPGGGARGEGRGARAGEPGGRGGMGGGRGEMDGGPGGPGGSAQMPGGMNYTPRFRNLVQKECSIGTVSSLTTYPRIPINKELWPYQMH